jgi:hypothetical protein
MLQRLQILQRVKLVPSTHFHYLIWVAYVVDYPNLPFFLFLLISTAILFTSILESKFGQRAIMVHGVLGEEGKSFLGILVNCIKPHISVALAASFVATTIQMTS